MHIVLFELLLTIIIVAIIAALCIRFQKSVYFALPICALLVLCSTMITAHIFNEYSTISESDTESYELVINDYISQSYSTGATVSYIDKNGKLKTCNITNNKIVYYEREPKIEFVTYRLGFIFKVEEIVYLNNMD